MSRRAVFVAVSLALAACSSSTQQDPANAGQATKEATPPAKAPEPSKAPEPAHVEPVAAAAAIGQPAPDFELQDVDGKAHKLADYRGKTVVLEWFNPGCPFVQYAHGEGPLKDQAKKTTADGVVWLSINSGGPGKQGHGVEANKEGASKWAMENPILIDESGAVGHLYGAEKTPHIFVIDGEGKLVYRGAIDNAPIGRVDGGGEYVNYLDGVLAAMKAGAPIAEADRPAYGCSVKYAKS